MSELDRFHKEAQKTFEKARPVKDQNLTGYVLVRAHPDFSIRERKWKRKPTR